MSFSKTATRELFDNPKSRHFSIVNDVLSLATIASILAIVMETVPSFNNYHKLFLIIEWVSIILFSLEYLLRLWSAQKPSRYAFSLFGIIDLVAIIPTYLGLGNLSFLKSARTVRIIRFLRLARITKLSNTKIEDSEESLGVFGFNIALYATTLTFVMLMLGVILHIFIIENGAYWSIPAGMFWSFSVFLDGLPAPIPEGTAGTIIFIITKFCGMALFGLLIGVISKIFNGWILGKKSTSAKTKHARKKKHKH
jgi:voltage-gated potassium channel